MQDGCSPAHHTAKHGLPTVTRRIIHAMRGDEEFDMESLMDDVRIITQRSTLRPLSSVHNGGYIS